jgi:hypothetical protein
MTGQNVFEKYISICDWGVVVEHSRFFLNIKSILLSYGFLVIVIKNNVMASPIIKHTTPRKWGCLLSGQVLLKTYSI